MSGFRPHSLLAFALGLAAALPVPSVADDTEVYVRPAGVSGGRANVLIILDTSGSMETLVPGTGKSRLDNMKEALHRVLDQLKNVNVGLMRFTNPGGPVLLPIADIDGDASLAYRTDDYDLVIPVAASEDDAEELVKGAAEDVALTDTRLELGRTRGFGKETSVTATVGSEADDAEEYVDDGQTVNWEPALDLAAGAGREQLTGLVFRKLAVPRGAYVIGGELSYSAYSSSPTDATLEIGAWSVDDAGTIPVGPAGTYGISSQPRTAARATMAGVEPWTSGNTYVSADLSAVIQEVVDRDGWRAGNALALVVGGKGGRQIYSRDTGPFRMARLSLTYATGKLGDQYVGLRFRGLAIPRGARIDSAVLEVSPSRALDDPVTLRVHAERVADARPFDADRNRPSAKLERKTAASVDWAIDEEWVERSSSGDPEVSPDLKAVLQEVVDQPEWCGGAALALVLSKVRGSGWRPIHSFDGKPSFAPTLKVNFTYNPSSGATGGGCMRQTVQTRVGGFPDDGEEDLSTGAVDLFRSSLVLRGQSGGNAVGLRFPGIPLEPGAQILDARIVFTAQSGSTGDAAFTVRGEATDDAATYNAAQGDISRRPLTGAGVAWDGSGDDPLTPWQAGKEYTTPDLSPILRELIARRGWRAGNSMALVVTGSRGSRTAHSYESTFAGGSGSPPRLRIVASSGLRQDTSSVVTVRQVLKQTVDTLVAGGWTPLVDTLYEAARYYRGEAVHWGKSRGHDEEFVQQNTRLSHGAAYVGGRVVRPAGCTDANLSSTACLKEVIEGDAAYVSPILDPCTYSYIILLTDGEANNNNSVELVKQLIRPASCRTRLSDNSPVTVGPPPENEFPDEECGVDLGKFIATEDQARELEGTQGIPVFTIGFNLDPGDPDQGHAIQFLKDLAAESGGEFRTATTADDLLGVFEGFFGRALNRTTAYATPALSVNAFNKLYHRDVTYLSLFEPSVRVRWVGNVKKYGVCTSSNQCNLGELLDADGNPATGDDGQILGSARSYWSVDPDGADVRSGGAANSGPRSGLRRVLTFTGDELPEGEPFESLGQDVHEVSVLNPELTATMLGLPVTASASDRATLIDWVRGRDVDNEDRDASGDTSDERYSFGDPLHSSPTVVTYGGTREQPVDKLFVGANDGALRMIDAATGEEEWAFFPPETLLKQAALRANAHGAHIYGMDLTPTAWVQDTDSNGVIDAGKGDFVRVIAGMRRGGNAYYGLDVTPSSPLTRPGEIAPTYPRLMWRIQGGTTAFPRLGQTGSRPVVTPLRVGTDTAGETDVRELLVFAGGYDAGQDDGFGPGGLGNALYLADPATGERLFWISGTAHASGDGVLVPDLAYPIPSDLTLLDADGDEVTDRLYVGDTGGQLWRIDLFPQDGVDGGLRVVVGKLLSASSDSDASDHRKFFYPPDVVQVADPRYAETSRYDLVILTSGDREHPVGTTVEDRAYALRDYWIGPLADAGDSQGGAAGDGLADGYEAIQGPLADLPGGDLFDATDTVSFEDEADLTELRAGRGWYLTLEGEGEKGLSSPVTLKGKLFFTTYLPTQSSDACYPAEGAGRLYGVDVLTARPIFNWGTAQAPGTKAARVYLLRSGVPSAAIPFVSKEGIRVLVGAGPGVSSIDPLIPLPWQRSYWVQED